MSRSADIMCLLITKVFVFCRRSENSLNLAVTSSLRGGSKSSFAFLRLRNKTRAFTVVGAKMLSGSNNCAKPLRSFLLDGASADSTLRVLAVGIENLSREGELIDTVWRTTQLLP